ncbi:hypothetical protein PhCBS80983_g03754 [Powellomyces hirtus]|uniref:UEV domain-containing protein n=1 Tax=Powellomyces hirtus TaxID=109895 RepID=A0A507E382_9FUNG|nr:hypothetical protein PhCBS80983_g03754 [Powellomyces hirtus]
MNFEQYQQRDRVFRDADAVLVNYNGLAPKTDTYTHEDGRTVVLLCMHGTVPISFRNITYNIPVALWVPHGYPAQPPICFVTPTSTMLVRASKHVDLSGKVYHPYLAYWHMNTEESTLLQFVRVLQEVFAQEPPVYTKPSNAAPAPQQNYQAPGFSGPPQQQQQQQPSRTSGNQPYQDSGRLQQPQPQLQPQHQSRQQQHTPPPPPPPPQQNYNHHPPPQYTSPTQHLAMPDPRRHATPPPSSSMSNQPPPIPPPPPSYAANRNSANNSPHPQHQQQQPQSYPQQPQQQKQRIPQQKPTPAAAPPVPHKPLAASIDTQAYQSAVDDRMARMTTIREVLKSRLRQKERELNASLPPDIERLLDVNKRLEEGEAQISTALKNAAAHENEIRASIETVQQKNAEVAAQIVEIQAQPDVDVDEILSGALFDLVAQDHAIDDTLYYLGKALDAEKIDGAVYMKNVRSLAREQFIKRALIAKIRAHIGLNT